MYPYPPANFAGDRHHRGLDKATSNVCTAQVLLANMAGMLPGLHHLREFSMGCPWDRVCPGFFLWGHGGIQNRWFIMERPKWMIWGYPYFRKPQNSLMVHHESMLFVPVCGGFPPKNGKTLGLNYPTQAHFAQRLEPS